MLQAIVPTELPEGEILGVGMWPTAVMADDHHEEAQPKGGRGGAGISQG